MNMLLTPAQLGPIIGMEPQYIDDYELSICQAQARHIHSWLSGDCTEHDTPAYVMGSPHVRIDCPECLEALRTVGGER